LYECSYLIIAYLPKPVKSALALIEVRHGIIIDQIAGLWARKISTHQISRQRLSTGAIPSAQDSSGSFGRCGDS
jgi:hypothetical protein